MTPIEEGGWEDYLRTYIELYPTQYAGKTFMLPMGWSRKLSQGVVDKVTALLAEKDRLLLEKVEGMRTVGAHLHDEGYNAAIDDFKRLIT
jgi:hypothetical protein